MLTNFRDFLKENYSFNQEIEVTKQDIIELNDAIEREIEEDFPYIKDYVSNGNKSDAEKYLHLLNTNSNLIEINNIQCKFIADIINIEDCDKKTTLKVK